MSVQSLATDILLLIRLNLSFLDFLSFRSTCKQYYSSIEDHILVSHDKRFHPHRLLIKAIRDGQTLLVKRFLGDNSLTLRERFAPGYNQNAAIILACELGHYDIVVLLLKEPSVDPSDMCNMAIRKACFHNHVQVVKLLLQDGRVDPSSANNYCLQQAVALGYDEIVKLLLNDSRIDPGMDQSVLLTKACWHEHTRIIHLLLNDSRIDLTNNGNLSAFKTACELGLVDIVDLFIQHPRQSLNVKNHKIITLLKETQMQMIY